MPFIDCDVARIAYDAVGCGPAVVLLHSTASSSAQWTTTRAALSGRFAMAAVDLYGYGASDPWPGHRAITLADEADAVARVASRFRAPVHLVGHSYGGAVALKLALMGCPLASLTLIEPVSLHLLRGERDTGLLREVQGLADAVTSAVRRGRPAVGLALFVDYWNGPGSWDGMGPERRDAVCRVADAVVRNFAAALDEPARLADCAALDVPTLLLAGGRSPRPTAHIAARLAATIPGADHRIVGEAGHMLPRTHPDAFLAELQRHLDRNPLGWEAAARLPSGT